MHTFDFHLKGLFFQSFIDYGRLVAILGNKSHACTFLKDKMYSATEK